MKVFIVLEYNKEVCEVLAVYTKRADAETRANRENNVSGQATYHVIGKSLKGHVARVGTRKKLIGYLIRR